jgi:Oxidoreductase molybdopterin binding domain
MTYPDRGASGKKSEIGTRYRAGSFSRFPLAPHQMRERYTRTQDLIVLCHLGVPELEIASWSLAVDGLVVRPRSLSFSELTAYPKRQCTSFHQCMRSPLRPLEPTRRVCNVRWSGAWLWASCETVDSHQTRNTSGHTARTMESSAVLTTRLMSKTCRSNGFNPKY